MSQSVDNWYTEPVHPTLLHKIKLKAVLFSGRTALQQVDIIETDPLGVTLVLDGKTQSAESDEFIYHEALVHPALIAHPNPKNVLICGGGEGAPLREVLAHESVERAVMVDMDAELVQICRAQLPAWHNGAFDDDRTELVFADAREYLTHAQESFDVIIMDITDPSEDGQSYLLFTQEFYRVAFDRLTEEGLIVTQAGPASHGMEHLFTAISATLKSVFGVAVPYHANMLSFGSDWGFVLAGRQEIKCAGIEELDSRIAARINSDLRYYDGQAHEGMFALPKWLRRSLELEQRVMAEDNRIFFL